MASRLVISLLFATSVALDERNLRDARAAADLERRSGGHVLDHVMLHGRVQVCVGTDLHLELPRTPEFAQANLDPEDLREQVDRAES